MVLHNPDVNDTRILNVVMILISTEFICVGGIMKQIIFYPMCATSQLMNQESAVQAILYCSSQSILNYNDDHFQQFSGFTITRNTHIWNCQSVASVSLDTVIFGAQHQIVLPLKYM